LSQPLSDSTDKLIRWGIGVSLGVGLLVVLNAFQFPYYLYYPRTTQTVLISPSLDLYLFLISSVSVPSTLMISRGKFRTSTLVGLLSVWGASLPLALVSDVGLTIVYVTVIGATILHYQMAEPRWTALEQILPSTLATFSLVEFACLTYWIGEAINPQARIGLMSEQVEANLTFALYPLAISMLIMLLLSWLWIPLVTRLPQLRKDLRVKHQPQTVNVNSRSIALSLDLFAIIAVIVFFFSYLAGQTWIVGVDSLYRYVDPINALAGLSPLQALSLSYHGAYLAVLYLIHLATGASSSLVVKYAPLLLAFATASAVFFAFLREELPLQLARLAAVTTLLWFPTTLGIYAGIQANWLALFFWMLFLALYLTRKEWSILTYFIESLLSLLIFLAHPWTWGVFFTTLTLTAIVSRRNMWRKRCVQGLLASLTLTLPVGAIVYELFPGLSSDLVNTAQLYSYTALNLNQLLTFGPALTELFLNWSSFISPVLLLLSLVGAYVISRRRGLTTNYVTAWVVTWCIGSVLVAPSGYNPINAGISETGLWRMLYVSPLPFLLAAGVEKCIALSNHSNPLAGPGPENPYARALLPWISPLLLAALGAVLCVTSADSIRLLIVVAAQLLTLLLALRVPNSRTLHSLTITVLALVILNAAFRSLFPLLLDPHNLLTSSGSSAGTGR